MKFIYIILVYEITLAQINAAQCGSGRSMTFARWSGVTPEHAPPVFVYTASGEEDSLVGACLARCRELDECVAVAVEYAQGSCHGVASSPDTQMRLEYDVTYFQKICLKLPEECKHRWWAVESTPGYHLHTEDPKQKVVLNTTVQECYQAVLSMSDGDQLYRSAQWVGPQGTLDSERIRMSAVGSCVLNLEDKFTEPESYRVSNYYTFYLENQCRHDYPTKIDRCSYEEYYNQTLKHVEFVYKNLTKDQCKSKCEVEENFVCRGFTWTWHGGDQAVRGYCDLHSEDLVTAGSWLLRRTANAIYYRRVICLNISVECQGKDLVVTYRPRSLFRGHVYVPGRGEQCSARATNGIVRLALPLHGDCDVNFAHGISNGPNGVINRTMAYVMVMIQNNPIIQTAGDRWVRVGCSPEIHVNAQVDATVTVRDKGRPSQPSEMSSELTPAGASAVFSPNTAPLTMYVVRATPDTGETGTAVLLGEPLELRIETTDDTEIEAYHLVASSRLGDSSVLLLDSKGCPTGQVDFPPFKRTWVDGTQRLSAKFKAFRFPTSHIVRFALMVRFCDRKCAPVNCGGTPGRSVRETNETYAWVEEAVPASVTQEKTEPPRASGVVAQGGVAACGNERGKVPLELEVVVRAGDVLSDALVRAVHQENTSEVTRAGDDSALVCVHELLLVALALTWLAVQVMLLLGCCILVKRYRNLAELSMQKDYQSFDNVGFDTVSTHRRVHWPDQNFDILHT